MSKCTMKPIMKMLKRVPITNPILFVNDSFQTFFNLFLCDLLNIAKNKFNKCATAGVRMLINVSKINERISVMFFFNQTVLNYHYASHIV